MLPPKTEQDRLQEVAGMILASQQQIISYAGTSQYQDFDGTRTGASACGLAALNCARILFRIYQDIQSSSNSSAGGHARRVLNGVLCQQTAEEITSICSSWPSDKHLEVEELLKVPIFKQSFENVKVHYALTDYANFSSVLRDMGDAKGLPVAAILTRSPEIIVCVKLPTDDSGDIFTIFDSHPRPAHPNGAGFIVNTSMDSTATYLNKLLAIDPKILADPSMRWQAQLFGQFSSHTVTSNSSPLSPTGLEYILTESSTTILRLQAELENARHRSEELATENDRLKMEITKLELGAEKTTIGEDCEGIRTAHQSHYANGPPSWQPSTSGSSTSGPASAATCVSASPSHFKDDTVLDTSENLITQLQIQYQEEDRVLSAERAALSARETPTFQCQICFDDMQIDYLAQMDECKHSFCRDCLRAHVTSTVGQRRYPVLCPACMADNAPEPTKISQSVLSTIGLTDETTELLRSIQIAPYSIALHCRKCKQTMFVDRKDHQESSTITCPLRGCNYVWCKSCERQIEIGGPQHSCDGSSELMHLMQRRGWKACPGCQTPIQKESGCNHMTCLSPGCNAHFCYLCGALMIQSVVRREIERATSAHYARCQLFEYPRRR